MIRKNFKNLLSQLDSLTRLQKQRLLDCVKNDLSKSQSINLIESHFDDIDCCPHCENIAYQRWGKSGGLQRYRCKGCLKTFNALSGTPLSGLRYKEQWLVFCGCLIDGHSVRKSAKHCGIDPTTAFRWRHKFLSSPMLEKSQKMVGIVEADETFFTESCKGSREIRHRAPRKRGKSSKHKRGGRVPVLLVRDRNATVADFVLSHIEKEIVHDCLRPLMSEEVLLCSDGSSLYQTFAEKEGIPHKRIISSENEYVIDDIFHIQNLNAYISRLKTWMKRFNGVATKYLANYLAWRRILEKQKGNISSEFCFSQSLGSMNQQLMQT